MGRLDDYDDIDDMLIVGGKTFVYKGTDTAKMIEEAYNKGKSDAEKEHLETCETCIHKVSKEEIERIKVDAIEDFAKWLETKEYLVRIEYDEDEDLEGNIVWNKFELFMESETVIAEYSEQLKEQK